MKTVLSTLLVLLCNMSFSQNLDYKNLKQLIGNRVNELEDFYKISSTSIEDNFGNQKVMYNSVKIEPYTVNLEVETEGKNIKRIVVTNSENRTSFFKNIAEEIEKEAPVKKNYKTYYISLVKKSTKKKTYQESVDQLIDLLKKPTTNLKDNYGVLESTPLKSVITINETESILEIN